MSHPTTFSPSREHNVVALTGAGGFLVSEMGKGLSAKGWKVALLDTNLENAERVADSIRKQNGEALAIQLDVCHKDQYESALKTILGKWGRLDGTVFGAGFNAPTPFMDITVEEWNKILAVQLTGTMLGCQVFGQQMLKQGRGSIVTISSASAGPPLSKAFTYSVAKAGVKNLTQNLAREWATQGVRVNALRPGFFPTEWSKQNFITPAREKAILGHTPMARYGKPSELVGAVAWLLSDEASFVTGSEVAVDGGFSAMTI
ncbi:MAG: SDR family oxidoreductase [Planctomycetes bacterium]|nr:SDR family oxidoreductase [Planctomycetota bacterium]